MKKIGANAVRNSALEPSIRKVRLYGNDPRENHKPFLDEAAKQGLEAAFCRSDSVVNYSSWNTLPGDSWHERLPLCPDAEELRDDGRRGLL